MEFEPSLASLSDDELLGSLRDLVSRSRRVEADLVAHIGEVDARRLFARQAFPSMFAYCTESLHLSEADAYRRITIARAARAHPELLEALRDGRVHLSGLALIISVITADNCAALLARAAHRTRRQIEELVAEQSPRPDAPSVIRKLPQRSQANAAVGTESPDSRRAVELFPGRVAAGDVSLPGATPPLAGAADRSHVPFVPVPIAATASGSGPAAIQPLAPARYRVQFTASVETRERLDRLVALLRSEIPNGDIALIIGRAIREMLERIEAKKFATVKAPRSTLEDSETVKASRHIPAAVRRAVRERVGVQCHFVDPEGRRCSERHRLEFHHRRPFAMGGDHSPGNISLLCRAHNRLMAQHDYGEATMAHRGREALAMSPGS